MRGELYWKKLDEYLWSYMSHEEAKFDGEMGILQRKNLLVCNLLYIGKESNRLDEAEILGVQKEDYFTYLNEEGKRMEVKSLNDFILSLTNQEASRVDIEPRQLRRWKKKIATGQTIRLTGKMARRLEKAMLVRSQIIAVHQNTNPKCEQSVAGIQEDNSGHPEINPIP